MDSPHGDRTLFQTRLYSTAPPGSLTERNWKYLHQMLLFVTFYSMLHFWYIDNQYSCLPARYQCGWNIVMFVCQVYKAEYLILTQSFTHNTTHNALTSCVNESLMKDEVDNSDPGETTKVYSFGIVCTQKWKRNKGGNKKKKLLERVLRFIHVR